METFYIDTVTNQKKEYQACDAGPKLFCVCDVHKMTGLQEYADWFLYSTDLEMESRALTVYSTSVGMPIATVVVVLFLLFYV